MNPSTQTTCPSNDSLSFRLHEQARRHRSRMIGTLLARLAGKISFPLPARLPIARWG